MLSIGEFSKICGVSQKTLRYYDEIGLIKPDEINPKSNYRYYSIDQLEKMLFIIKLKSYNFSLDEIKELINLETYEQEEALIKSLIKKRDTMEENMKKIKYNIKQLEKDISNLQNGVSIIPDLNDSDIQLVETQPLNIISIRKILTEDDYKNGYIPYFSKLYQKIAKENLTLIGEPMAIYHSPDYDPLHNDTEFALAVEEYATGTRDFPGSLCAKSTLNGNYSGLTEVYAKLMKWIEENRYKIIAPPYEVYLNDPYTTNPNENITEVYFPIKKNR